MAKKEKPKSNTQLLTAMYYASLGKADEYYKLAK